jgi:hypothetical protein
VGRHHIDGDGLPGRNGRAVFASGLFKEEKPSLAQSDDGTSPESCDADTQCGHVPCFQVQLDGSRPRQAHQRANACAYHVADVIEALRGWAAEHGVTDGALTILAIEPAAGGRQPAGEDQPDLRGFAFSTIPLDAGPRRDPQPGAASPATPAEPEP